LLEVLQDYPRSPILKQHDRLHVSAVLFGALMDLLPDQARAFVGPEADYYVARWERIAEQGSRALGFNWAAFFLHVFWLLYRRMYSWFWMTLAVIVGLIVIQSIAVDAVLRNAPSLAPLMVIVVFAAPVFFWVIFGTLGTYWYYLHARRRVRRITAGSEPDLEAIGRAGGTNWWAPVLAAIIWIGLDLQADSSAAPHSFITALFAVVGIVYVKLKNPDRRIGGIRG
jgi:hypothetical protein